MVELLFRGSFGLPNSGGLPHYIEPKTKTKSKRVPKKYSKQKYK